MSILRGNRSVVEQIIRPTGLLDPRITIRGLKNQIDDTIELCRQRVEQQERVLVTTLTKRTAEDLADYLRDVGLKVRYLHSDIDTIERVEILRGLRAADFDILVGINLLREGLDLPEVSLVCILDADKEGFLRSQTSLIQTAGRAARHINGEVVLFADQRYRQHAGVDFDFGISADQTDRIQRETWNHATDGAKGGAGKFAHDFAWARDCFLGHQRSGRKLRSDRIAAGARRRNAARFGQSRVRAGGAVARSNHGSKERHRANENRTETPAGEIHAQQRATTLAGISCDLGAPGSHCRSSRAPVEGSRHESFKVTHRDPSTELGMTCFEIGSRTRLAALNAMRVQIRSFSFCSSACSRERRPPRLASTRYPKLNSLN